MNKVLSIIIPSYNMEKYLPKCLGSLIVADKELLQKLDVIVVNDGSKDRTSEIAHEFEAKYPDVFRVVDKINGNYGSCINAALPKARGEFVKILDADDYFGKSGLIALLRVLDKCESDVDLIISEYATVDPIGEIVSHSKYDLPRDVIFDLKKCCNCSNRLFLHAITYRREVFERFPYHQTEGISYTDTEWIIEPMAFVRKVRYIPEIVSNYLVGRDGQTMNVDAINRSFHMVSRITLGLAGKWGVYRSVGARAEYEYFDSQVLGMIRMVYLTNIYKWPGVRSYPNDNIELFDRGLASASPELYDMAGSTLIPSNHFPFYPIKEYRRWHTKDCPPILLHKLYSYFAKLIPRLTK